jgi:hypothetical protein
MLADWPVISTQNGPLVMGIALHPYLVGYPYRLRELRRALDHVNKSNKQLWLTTCGAIAEYVAKLPSAILPGGS